MAEQDAVNVKVVGSNPTSGARFKLTSTRLVIFVLHKYCIDLISIEMRLIF